MARAFCMSKLQNQRVLEMVTTTQRALDAGIAQARDCARLSSVSAAIQQIVEASGYGVVRDFAGHGIGKKMHEDPELLNYGNPGKGPILKPGMAFAIEPMLTMGKYDVYVTSDGWTVKTVDKSLAAHIEDTIVITESEPIVLTRVVDRVI